jgi:hypothetical protein
VHKEYKSIMVRKREVAKISNKLKFTKGGGNRSSGFNSKDLKTVTLDYKTNHDKGLNHRENETFFRDIHEMACADGLFLLFSTPPPSSPS